jgi:ABC-type antimicrobial peptide transport system permease subunit
VVRLAPGVNRARATSRLTRDGEAAGFPHFPTVPSEVDRLRQIDFIPALLAGFVGVVALTAVGYALVTALRHRQRDLAILKTLGFGRRQVRASVACQATTIAVVGVVLGIPLGILAGRFVWRLVARGLGVSADAAVPALWVLVVIPVAMVLANIIAAFPARSAARTRPAAVLRSE